MKNLIIILFFFLVCCSQLFAQQPARGSIEGIVINSEGSHPVIGANVVLQGTVLGAVTDNEGNFRLKNIPAGKYNLTVSMIGFKRKEITLEIVPVEIKRISIELNPTPIQTEPVIITASKREQSLQEVPVSVSVVDEQDLSYRNTITIDDALRYVPGVNVTHGQVNIRSSTGYSHGVGSRVLLLIDGLPMLSGDTDEIIWESIPTSNVQKIEIVKGSGSALYGSSALGGVINVITKSVQEKPETQLRMYGGFYVKPKYTTWQWTQSTQTFSGMYASHSRKIGDLGLAVGGSRTLDDGYKRNDFWKRWNTWIRLGYDISPYQTMTLSFNLLDQRRGNFLYWKDLTHALESDDDQLNQRVQSIRGNINGSYKHFLTNEFFYIVKFNWFRSKWEDNISSQDFPSGSSSRSDFMVGEVQANYQLADQHILIGGITGSFNRVTAEAIFGKRDAQGGSIYLQDEIKFFKDIIFTLGARYDIQKLKTLESVNQFNPKIGIVYNPTPTSKFYTSVGRGFRAPSVAEVFTTTESGGFPIRPNPSLKPEKSWSYEIGSSLTLTEYFAGEISIFRNDFWDMIEPKLGDSSILRFQNVIRARITGAELSLSLYALERIFQSQLSYTYAYPEDVFHKTILNHRSRHLLYQTNKISIDPIQLGLDFRYVSKMERIDSLLLKIIKDADKRVSSFVIDFHLGVDWTFAGAPVTAAFHINNLLQYYYTDFIGNLAPLRNYVLTLETRL
ncbi:MAG: TonB-dependent receptor [Bacteroidota bacterium]|nr:TonB-dependent receptor [Bacteroidota bacterium]